MIRFSEEKVLLLHQLLIAETGGSPEIRDHAFFPIASQSKYMEPSAVDEELHSP